MFGGDPHLPSLPPLHTRFPAHLSGTRYEIRAYPSPIHLEYSLNDVGGGKTPYNLELIRTLIRSVLGHTLASTPDAPLRGAKPRTRGGAHFSEAHLHNVGAPTYNSRATYESRTGHCSPACPCLHLLSLLLSGEQDVIQQSHPVIRGAWSRHCIHGRRNQASIATCLRWLIHACEAEWASQQADILSWPRRQGRIMWRESHRQEFRRFTAYTRTYIFDQTNKP